MHNTNSFLHLMFGLPVDGLHGDVMSLVHVWSLKHLTPFSLKTNKKNVDIGNNSANLEHLRTSRLQCMH